MADCIKKRIALCKKCWTSHEIDEVNGIFPILNCSKCNKELIVSYSNRTIGTEFVMIFFNPVDAKEFEDEQKRFYAASTKRKEIKDTWVPRKGDSFIFKSGSSKRPIKIYNDLDRHNQEYDTNFKTIRSMLEHYVGGLGWDPKILRQYLPSISSDVTLVKWARRIGLVEEAPRKSRAA